MSRKVTRRRFLQRGIEGSLVTLASAQRHSPISVASVWAEAKKAGNAAAPAAAVLSAPQREVLRAAADEIIPAGDGMPAAGEVGAVEYIEALLGKVPPLLEPMEAALARLETLATVRFGHPFARSSSAQRVRLLQTFEKEAARRGAGEGLFGAAGPNLFAALRDLVYEAYYTSPKVWPRLDYQFYPTNSAGPAMMPFDEAILAQARKRPKSYREGSQ